MHSIHQQMGGEQIGGAAAGSIATGKLRRPAEQPRRVLIVDDDPGYCLRLADLVADEGFDVETAVTGREAIDAGRRRRFDLLIVDWMLCDDLDGFDVADALRATTPEVETILITGYPTPALSAKAVGSRVRAVVYKPFEPDELLGTIHRVLDDE